MVLSKEEEDILKLFLADLKARLKFATIRETDLVKNAGLQTAQDNTARALRNLVKSL